MSIVISIIESEEQVVAGFPKKIMLETNIPASIFYTEDGTLPTEDSEIFVDEIILPTNKSSIVYKFFATNGVDTSEIIEKKYINTFINLKLTQSIISNYNNSVTTNLSPFGDGNNNQVKILNGVAGTIVDDSAVDNYLDGYDENSDFVGYVDSGFEETIQTVYSETNDQGIRDRGIGTLPSSSIIRTTNEVPTQSNFNDKFFNPKAKVIFKSSDDIENDDLCSINHKAFALYDPRKNISSFFAGGTYSLQSPGGMLRQQFNPTDQTLNYYYFDSRTLTWIISKEKYHNKVNNNYSNIITSSRTSSAGGFVFKWYPFKRYRII